jgi:hypothetical protein
LTRPYLVYILFAFNQSAWSCIGLLFWSSLNVFVVNTGMNMTAVTTETTALTSHALVPDGLTSPLGCMLPLILNLALGVSYQFCPQPLPSLSLRRTHGSDHYLQRYYGLRLLRLGIWFSHFQSPGMALGKLISIISDFFNLDFSC